MGHKHLCAVRDLMACNVYLPDHPPIKVWSGRPERPINPDSAISFGRRTTVPWGRVCAPCHLALLLQLALLSPDPHCLLLQEAATERANSYVPSFGDGPMGRRKFKCSNRGGVDQVALKMPSCSDTCSLDRKLLSSNYVPGCTLSRGETKVQTPNGFCNYTGNPVSPHPSFPDLLNSTPLDLHENRTMRSILWFLLVSGQNKFSLIGSIHFSQSHQKYP